MSEPGGQNERPADAAERQEERGSVAPAVTDEPAPGPAFYRLDSSKITFIECWWDSHSPLLVPAWLIMKCFRVRLQGPTDDPPVESLDDFEVPATALPVPVRQRLIPLTQELVNLGFRSPICHAIDCALQSTQTYLVSLPHPKLPVVARLHDRIWTMRTPPKETLFTEFITAFPNGEHLWSLSSKPDMLAPPSCRIVRREGASPLELWKAHEEELAKHELRHRALPASNAEQVRAICDRLHADVKDFHLHRGVFAPLTKTDAERISSLRSNRQEAAAGGSQYPEILAELDRLQNKRTGWAGTTFMLAVSILLFLGIGLPGQSSFPRLLMLVPVLLFHECGHYLAMRIFGYRNLRMFFIPGFGAAVSGQHFNVPGWKKALVSLMGPLPGIIVGIPLGIYGAIWDKPLALDVALLMMILNGLNLLPVLPLDGGHIVHTVLFSRHCVLDVVFRVGAAFVLGVLAAACGDRVLLFVAVIMFVGLPWAFQMAKVTGDLRREGFDPVSPDSQSIPPAMAERIITSLKTGAKKPQASKLVAQRVLQVFETLNTRPPGWLASAGIMLVHVLSFMTAVVCTLALIFAQHGGRDLLRAGAHAPRHSISAAAIRESPRSREAESQATSHDTIVATFARAPQAAAVFDEVKPHLEPGETVILLGNTLLIRFLGSDDEARERWLSDLQPRAADVFVDGDAMRASFRFAAVARDEATAQAIVDELQQYFGLPLAEGLVAPWSPSASLTREQRVARKTFIRLRTSNVYEDPAMVEVRNKLAQAQRRGKQTEAKDLAKQLQLLYAQLERRRLQKLADDRSSGVDTTMARRYLELYEELKPDEFYKTVMKEFASRLGQASLQGEEPDAVTDGTWARSGFASRTGLAIQVQFVSFCDAGSGAKALVTWLADKGCQGMRYDVSGESTEPDSEDEASGDDEARPGEPDQE